VISLSKLLERCPICRGEMEEGYIFLTGLSLYFKTTLSWSDKKPLIKYGIFWLPPKERTALLHWDGDFKSLKRSCMRKAYKCSNCKIVIFNYDEEDNDDL